MYLDTCEHLVSNQRMQWANPQSARDQFYMLPLESRNHLPILLQEFDMRTGMELGVQSGRAVEPVGFMIVHRRLLIASPTQLATMRTVLLDRPMEADDQL